VNNRQKEVLIMTQLPQWGRNHYMRETKNGSQHAPAARHAYPIKHSNTRASGCSLHGDRVRTEEWQHSSSKRESAKHAVTATPSGDNIVFRCLHPTVTGITVESEEVFSAKLSF